MGAELQTVETSEACGLGEPGVKAALRGGAWAAARTAARQARGAGRRPGRRSPQRPPRPRSPRAALLRLATAVPREQHYEWQGGKRHLCQPFLAQLSADGQGFLTNPLAAELVA